LCDRAQVAIVDVDEKAIAKLLDAGRKPRRKVIIGRAIAYEKTAQ
jgi:hypothetical protein